MAQWQASFGPDTVPATASRELPTPLTVLTYQALCTLGAAGNGEEAGGGPRTRLGADGVLSLLHPNGRALIARLQAGGPWTLVLDECHHLLELWGRLLQAVVGQLDKPRIVGLTATPPHLMTAEQAVLHRALFGAVDLEVSAPALVREGLLAPYQELAFLTRPSPTEPTTSLARPSASRNSAPGCSTPRSPASRSWAGCRPGWWSGAVRPGRRCPGRGSRRTSPRWPTRPSGCTWPGCWTCRRGPGSGSSTGIRLPPRTG